MATTREIKNRIKSVKDTQKITNAMYLISSTKMRKARREAEASKPYFDLLRREIRRMFAAGGKIHSVFLNSAVDDSVRGGRYGVLVITADKGLAGAYNQNVIKETQALISMSDEYVLYVIGEVGQRFFRTHGYNTSASFGVPMPEPSLGIARTMATVLLDEYDKKAFDRLYVVYTDFTSGMSSGVATHDRLLPFDKDDFTTEGDEIASSAEVVFEYDPGIEKVLDSVLPSYMMGYIYSALVNSYSSEQTARMMAMDAANDNANELMGHLSLEYNHLRQNAITQEITEISSGARGLKRNELKRKKRKEEQI